MSSPVPGHTADKLKDFGIESGRFPHPFTDGADFDYYDFDEPDPPDLDTPRTLVELRMCALSTSIREKAGWHVKFRDEKIRSRWIEEIHEQQKDVHPSLQLTDNMINYVLTELEAYAALRDESTGIEPGPYERVWRSDKLIPSNLKSELRSAVYPLESVPDSEKDWHPGSDGKVLDLVHPSLYPVIYGLTVTTSGEPIKPREDNDVPSIFNSERFQWLPSDFHVGDDGSVSLASPYINNIHPEDHAVLQKVILKTVERAVPLFEWVLSDLARERQVPTRMDLKGELFPTCIWPEGEPPPVADDEEEAAIQEEVHRLEAGRGPGDPFVDFYNVVSFKWYDRQPKKWPDSKPAYDGGLDDVKKTINLRGRTLQLIVKLANIVLTPEKPEYPGGKWHVEGMNNEAIVATFIYYYDCDNLTESTLSFRNGVSEPRYHGQDDNYCMVHLYGIDRDDPCAQDVGKIITKEDRCIAFPNLYQHLVAPFRLADPTRPGHRKILVFFLVDPHITIPSASVVAPQQASWKRRAISGTPMWERLPVELQDIVADDAGMITFEQAKAYREELMSERTIFVDTVNGERFGHEYNMCEH
ncbi:hypothetical protein FOMPIDRAFT_1048621 [Fomitopsis schrenkii]|uniref:Uncharacterized protein n=1 Tax=Fomitopsis schrenkii TaxID=2126942 RepID=S8EEZ3_FOMSC|nr:hypothetical protein FOMPIDRAFT_1048621 [Fomitopsis schrenkii]